MHKTLISGTEYDVNGGKALVGGTSYGISKGRTLVGGTGYDISFGTWRDRFIRLMQNATVAASDGRSSSSGNRVRIYFSSLPQAGTYYFFILYSAMVSIVKIVYDGSQCTKTDLFGTSTGYTVVINNSGTGTLEIGYYRGAGAGAVEVIETDINAGGMFAFQFSGFVEENIDNILSAFTAQNIKGGDWTSKDYLYVPETTNALLVQYASYVALSFPYGTLILSNNTYGGEPFSLLWQGYGNYYLSKSPSDGRSRTYGGNIIEL